MSLIRVKKGIYALKESERKRDKNVFVAVHPYFAIPGDQIPLNYTSRLEKLVALHSGVIVTLEEKRNLKNTAQKYKEMTPCAERYFIPTQPCSPEPAETNWKQTILFLKRFEKEPFVLIGGYDWRKKYTKELSLGCLGTVYQILKEQGCKVHVRSDLTFS